MQDLLPCHHSSPSQVASQTEFEVGACARTRVTNVTSPGMGQVISTTPCAEQAVTNLTKSQSCQEAAKAVTTTLAMVQSPLLTHRQGPLMDSGAYTHQGCFSSEQMHDMTPLAEVRSLVMAATRQTPIGHERLSVH